MHEHVTRLANVARRQDYPNSRPRDAATLILVDTSQPDARVLMGRRHDGHIFMPGKYVFPGGRIEPGDYRIAAGIALHPEVERQLQVDMKGRASPAKARALALTAIRETFEETGILVGRSKANLPETRSPAWGTFLSHGVVPDATGLSFVCRAITPPRRPRRYDTRFFCASADAIAHEAQPLHSELTDVHWLPLSRARALDLPTITQIVLEALAERLNLAADLPAVSPVPYYYMHRGIFRRDLIE